MLNCFPGTIGEEEGGLISFSLSNIGETPKEEIFIYSSFLPPDAIREVDARRGVGTESCPRSLSID